MLVQNAVRITADWIAIAGFEVSDGARAADLMKLAVKYTRVRQ